MFGYLLGGGDLEGYLTPTNSLLIAQIGGIWRERRGEGVSLIFKKIKLLILPL